MIETDRFCDQCGYNLRTQSVRREPSTAVLMARCPECGRFHAAADATSATRPWLRRLAGFLLTFWILLVVALILAIGVLEFAMFAGVADELTGHRRVGNTYEMYVRYGPGDRDYSLFMGFVLAGCVGLGLLTGWITTVACTHWRKYGYYVLVLVLPLLAFVCCLWLWYEECPQHLHSWAKGYALLFMWVEMVGGAIGVLTGRPFARGIVRVVLPPRWRGPLAFLWIADGKELPAGKRV